MILQGDCLDLMLDIPSNSIDMIFCDLPYGTTKLKWDSIIPFNRLWAEYERLIKDNGAIILTASQPFTSALVMSNPKIFKHEWIWQKASGSNFATLKFQPMKEHESVLIFSKGSPVYNPIFEKRKGGGADRAKYSYKSDLDCTETIIKLKTNRTGRIYLTDLRNPSSVQYFNNREKSRGLHPTQKPILLLEYLIKTYSNENDVVLDNCAGSGTTAIACINTNRKYICIEKDEKYFNVMKDRIKNHLTTKV